MKHRARFVRVCVLSLLVCWSAAVASGDDVSDRLAEITRDLPPPPAGILIDRALPLADIGRFDGSFGSVTWPLESVEWRRLYDMVNRAAEGDPRIPPLSDLLARAEGGRSGTGRGVVRPGRPVLGGTAASLIQIAILNVLYDRIRPDALESGALTVRGSRLEPGAGDPYVRQRVFAASATPGVTFHGEQVVFHLDPELLVSNDPVPLGRTAIDFDDGAGFVSMRPDEHREVRYAEPGQKTIRLRMTEGGRVLQTAFHFRVEALRIPTPDDTLHVTAAVPYAGGYGTGDGYVYLADGHSRIENPLVVLEGFDLDNSMGWDVLYTLLNEQNLLEDLRGEGYDFIVFNFDDATDYIQRNALAAVELLQEVRGITGPEQTIALAGASMGGLVGRYALAWMETQGIAHGVRTFVSFDSPQTGADIPLGIQYWLAFFQDQSSEAAALLAALDAPAARQLLVYHHTDPPGSTGEMDPLRTELLSELSGLGEYPQMLRKVAVANGSGQQAGQGFNPGDQIIRWEYSSFLIDITGNVWAVPSSTSRTIFYGLIDIILLPPDEQYVSVALTRPYDNAPGGWRNSMAEMDAVSAPYGDIVALHPNHCFIPTVSALALRTDDLFYDISGDPNILALTPFDAVYFPVDNQEHVLVTAENKEWIMSEVRSVATDVTEGHPVGSSGPETLRAGIESVAPNPVRPGGAGSAIRFTLPAAGRARLAVFDVAGRRVATLAEGDFPAGSAEVAWDGTSERGSAVSPGVYFIHLEGAGFGAVAKLVVGTGP
jgi:hypothetical protein